MNLKSQIVMSNDDQNQFSKMDIRAAQMLTKLEDGV